LASSSEAALFLFLIERMRLSLSPHPQLSVIALAFGFTVPNFRSSDLWVDTTHSVVPKQPQLFDLVLRHEHPDPWGAHVGGYLGSSLILHLSQRLGAPAIEGLEILTQRPQYRYLIGFKRILMTQGRTQES
jgi:lipoprotein Spr